MARPWRLALRGVHSSPSTRKGAAISATSRGLRAVCRRDDRSGKRLGGASSDRVLWQYGSFATNGQRSLFVCWTS